MALDPAARAAMALINKRLGPGSIVQGSQIQDALVKTITTGSLSFDVALGGGWAADHWNEIVGHSQAGKTMLLLKTIAANQQLNPKFLTLWIAAEDFDVDYAEMIGVDLDRILLLDENIMEVVFQAVLDFLKERSVDLIVLDSLPALFPSGELQKNIGDAQPGRQAILVNQFFRDTNKFMKRSLIEKQRTITGLVVNQWRMKFTMFGDPRTTPGGGGKDYFCYQRVEVIRKEDIKNSKQLPVGQKVELRTMKNKISPRGRRGEVDFYFAENPNFAPGEYDEVKDLTAAAELRDILKVKGKFWIFDDQTWLGRGKRDAAIADDEKLQLRIKKAVRAAMSRERKVVKTKSAANQNASTHSSGRNNASSRSNISNVKRNAPVTSRTGFRSRNRVAR